MTANSEMESAPPRPPQDLTGAAVSAALSYSLQRLAEHSSWGTLALGAPAEHEGPWLTLTDLTAPECRDRLFTRIAAHDTTPTPETVLGNYLFRYALNSPLKLAGFLFIAERRVPRLAGNLLLRDAEWLQDARLLAPHLSVLPDDPLAGEAGVEIAPDVQQLGDALVAEVERAYAPLLAAYQAQRYVTPTLAWGSMLDGLAQGVLAAGQTELGMDAAWARWAQLLNGRSLPVRRRPVRFSYDVEGDQGELAVRAGCCLWFTTPAAAQEAHPYCTTCYLTSDAQRLQIIVNYKRRLAAEAAASSS